MCYSLTWADKKRIEKFKESAKKECIYCGKKLVDKRDVITVDHLLPISRNGKTIESNLGICCEKCNSEKSDMTYEEYIEYLNVKKDLSKNNRVWNEFDSAIKSFQEIINIYNKAVTSITKLNKEKIELETIMKDTKANASEGYCLFRDFQNILKQLEENQRIQNTTYSANRVAKESIKQLEAEKLKLENKIINEIRNECNIGSIGKLNIDKIDFSKWTRQIQTLKVV